MLVLLFSNKHMLIRESGIPCCRPFLVYDHAFRLVIGVVPTLFTALVQVQAPREGAFGVKRFNQRYRHS